MALDNVLEKILEIESMDTEARGVGHIPAAAEFAGKVVFVEGALPGERVRYQTFRKKAQWEMAKMTQLKRASAARVEPLCERFGICGGCAMQHLDASAQVAIKQRVLENDLKHIGKVTPEMILRPIHGPSWEYRYRARLAVRYVIKKGVVLVGFHEKKSHYVVDMTRCPILPKPVSNLLMPLRDLIAALSIATQIPQIELAVGESGMDSSAETGAGSVQIALVLRIMQPLTSDDEIILREFADLHGIQWWLQPKGLDTVALFYPPAASLCYRLPEFNVQLPFIPTDFIQINPAINQVLVSRALRLLDLQNTDRVLDLFCGLGNFTLPIATRAQSVVGIEGNETLVARARQNAQINRLAQNSHFFCSDLFTASALSLKNLGYFDKLLIDPPRDGAIAVCQALVELENDAPKRIVYVSCNPATLARDAACLVNSGAYRLIQAGVINMFPHTAHVESIAVFEKK